jgi:hypothetical protein
MSPRIRRAFGLPSSYAISRALHAGANCKSTVCVSEAELVKASAAAVQKVLKELQVLSGNGTRQRLHKLRTG